MYVTNYLALQSVNCCSHPAVLEYFLDDFLLQTVAVLQHLFLACCRLKYCTYDAASARFYFTVYMCVFISVGKVT